MRTEQEIIDRAEYLISCTNVKKFVPELKVRTVRNKKSYAGYAGKNLMSLNADDLENAKDYELDMLIIHELAHYYSPGCSHNEKFHKKMGELGARLLLQGAITIPEEYKECFDE